VFFFSTFAAWFEFDFRSFEAVFLVFLIVPKFLASLVLFWCQFGPILVEFQVPKTPKETTNKLQNFQLQNQPLCCQIVGWTPRHADPVPRRLIALCFAILIIFA